MEAAASKEQGQEEDEEEFLPLLADGEEAPLPEEGPSHNPPPTRVHILFKPPPDRRQGRGGEEEAEGEEGKDGGDEDDEEDSIVNESEEEVEAEENGEEPSLLEGLQPEGLSPLIELKLDLTVSVVEARGAIRRAVSAWPKLANRHLPGQKLRSGRFHWRDEAALMCAMVAAQPAEMGPLTLTFSSFTVTEELNHRLGADRPRPQSMLVIEPYIYRSLCTFTHESDKLDPARIEKNSQYPPLRPRRSKPAEDDASEDGKEDGSDEEEEDENPIRPKNTPAVIAVLNQLRNEDPRNRFMDRLFIDFEEDSDDEEEEDGLDDEIYDSDDENGPKGLLAGVTSRMTSVFGNKSLF